ncbi:MAG TPA: penicillin-binding protein activator LpoB [Candidatus Krumholzibacteria bacterium]|nr:penicillin-binding protein activator LpoB [Candidatus Krumholzibacteria bacterium]
MSRVTLSRGVLLTLLSAAMLVSLSACGGKSVQRIGTDTTVDISGNWNDTDSRLVSEEMIAQVLSQPWLARFEATHQDRPTVIVGTVRNNSSEHIDTNIFTKNLEIAFINSGRVRVVASRDERGEVREERDSQQDWSDPATVKKMGMELGADYMLIGSLGSIVDEEGSDKVVFYQTNLELIDIQTNEKVWIGQKQIKKYIGKSKYKA